MMNMKQGAGIRVAETEGWRGLGVAGAVFLLVCASACGSDASGDGQDGGRGRGDAAGTDGRPTSTDVAGGGGANDRPDSGNGAVTPGPGGGGANTPPVNLGTAGSFVILAKSGVSTVPKSAVTGDVGVSPAAASYITGFSLVADATNVFSTAPQITGKAYASDYAAPTPAKLTTAIGDMERAFTDAAGRAAGVTELGAGNIGGMTLSAGVYKWGTGLLIPTDVTLSGNATSVWIFQIAQDLTVSSGRKIVLTGGALAKNVFWQVAGRAELGTTAHLEGVVLTRTSITMRTGASVNGRLLAQTAVVIDGSTIVQPAP